jgi:hypothetical protein
MNCGAAYLFLANQSAFLSGERPAVIGFLLIKSDSGELFKFL